MSYYQGIKDIIAGGRARDPRHMLRGYAPNETFVKVRLQDLEEIVNSHDAMDSIVRAEHFHLQDNDGVITVHAMWENPTITNIIMMQLITAGYVIGDIEEAGNGRAYIPFRRADKDEPRNKPQPQMKPQSVSLGSASGQKLGALSTAQRWKFGP